MEKKNNTNLDAVINEVGFEIAKLPDIDKTEINKLLGILAMDGVYAMWVYLLSKSTSKAGKLLLQIEKFKNYIPELEISELEISELEKHSKDFKEVNNEALEEIEAETSKRNNELSKKISDIIHNIFANLSKNLHNLLFFKEIMERTLIYARYHTKAMGV